MEGPGTVLGMEPLAVDYDHYKDTYWNDIPYVIDELKRRSTGDVRFSWADHVRSRYADPPRRRALIIGCGNGWVDRSIYDMGLAQEIDAFDASERYLKLARADRGDRPINYFQSTYESFQPRYEYDLIINHAALHHARFLYHACLKLDQCLAADGVFVNWEYVGPSRNQYPPHQLEQMENWIRSVPPRFATQHGLRPSLREMLKADPTEAVHSSRIPAVLHRVFEVEEWHELGGGLAYQLLWNNIDQFLDEDDAESNKVLHDLMDRDMELTRSGDVPNLFVFAILRKRSSQKRVPLRMSTERLREWLALRMRGAYLNEFSDFVVRRRLYDPTVLAPIAKRRLLRSGTSSRPG